MVGCRVAAHDRSVEQHRIPVTGHLIMNERLRDKLVAALSDWVTGDSEVKVVEGFRGPVLKLRTVSAMEAGDPKRKGKMSWFMKWGRGTDTEDYVLHDLASIHKLGLELREQWNDWVALYKAKEVKLAEFKRVKGDYEDLISVMAVIQRNMQADEQGTNGSSGMSESLQRWLVKWIVQFGGADRKQTDRLMVELRDHLPDIPDKFKRVSSSIVYRGVRVPVAQYKKLLKGGKLTFPQPYLSFSASEEVAARFATDTDSDIRGGSYVGLMVEAKGSKAVLDLYNCYKAFDKRIRTREADDLALYEQEVIVSNKPALTLDKTSVTTVFVEEDQLKELFGDKADEYFEEYEGFHGDKDIIAIPLKVLLKGTK